MNKRHLLRIKSFFQEKQVHNFSNDELQEMIDTIDLLCSRGVLRDLQIDNANAYQLTGDFSVFDEWLKEKDRQKKKETHSDRWHDVRMVVLGAFLGGLVEYLLFKIFGIGG